MKIGHRIHDLQVAPGIGMPEGKVLTALSRKLGIAESDKFGLLRAIGGDCAGVC
ncbi:MAG: HipA N-terminal domain-containing protein [Desulfotignum sp.]